MIDVVKKEFDVGGTIIKSPSVPRAEILGLVYLPSVFPRVDPSPNQPAPSMQQGTAFKFRCVSNKQRPASQQTGSRLGQIFPVFHNVRQRFAKVP